MKKRLTPLRWLSLLGLTAALLVLLFRLPAIAQTPRSYKDLTYPPLSKVTIPDYQRYTLKNGIVVFLMEDHALPLVKGTALFRGGSRFDPADKVGLALVTGETLRSGGTKQHPPDELNELLEQRAASVETSVDITAGKVSFDVLSEDVVPVFDLFSQVIQEPAFDPAQIDLLKKQLQGAIARRNDNPSDIARREFRKIIYGNSSPYARTIEYSTLGSISRPDILSFYQSYVRPQGMILGIVGDFKTAEMKALIEKRFGAWTVSTPAPNLVIPTVKQQYNRGVFLVDQPQLTQSNILLGQLGGQFDSPDYPALSVLSGVFNGFGGRLFNNLRSRQGLAYTVYGVWSASYDFPGLFVAGGQTRSEKTVPFVKSLLQEVERVRTTPIEAKELAYAKDSILNAFVFNFENPVQTLARLLNYEFFGYPADFIFKYQEGVQNTTIQDVQRVAQKYLQPDKISTLVVGSEKQIQPSLTSISSDVRLVDVSIPKPKQG